jgi:proteasome accessory factor A
VTVVNKELLVSRVTGADIELGNFIRGLSRTGGTGYEASRALLREVQGITSQNTPATSGWGVSGSWNNLGYANAATVPTTYYSQDHGRKYLPNNGGCIYVDLNHLEVCIPEIFGAHQHVAATHAMFEIARDAQRRANARLPEGQEIQVLVNNSDGLGHSYGSHLNFLLRRETWDDIFHRKPHYLAYLASHQASGIVYTGQGKVGSENGEPWVPYQLSSRADFIETLQGEQTTYTRPLVNSRDEALCGSPSAANQLARLHCISFDSNLAHGAMLLKVGTMQIVLTMLEAGVVDLDLLLDDPVDAMHRWSHDPSLQQTCCLASGEQVTAVELQTKYLEEAKRFADTGVLDGIVPRYDEILDLWEDTLSKLGQGNLDALTARLDWVLKLQILEQAIQHRAELNWQSSELKFLDQMYGHLDHAKGLYWAYEKAGAVESLVTQDDIKRLLHHPPEDTRAWTRAMLLQSAAEDEVKHVDWDSLTFELTGEGQRARTVVVTLPDPRRYGRTDTNAAFARPAPLREILRALGANVGEHLPTATYH